MTTPTNLHGPTAATPFDRLATAEALLGLTAAPETPGIHLRAAAFLLRRTLEDRVSTYIQHNRPDLGKCTNLTKSIWLARHLARDVAGRYASVWSALSQACHFHTYTLAPTLAELRSWHEEVLFVLQALPVADTPTLPASSVTVTGS